MLIRYVFISLMLFHHCHNEVILKMFISVPQVKLECTITNPVEGTSAFLHCPMNKLCFRNCMKICSKCDVKCSEINTPNKDDGPLLRFVYIFNGSLPENQGDWICSYGVEKATTGVYMSVPKNSRNTKRDVEMVSRNQSINHNKTTQIQRKTTTTKSVVLNKNPEKKEKFVSEILESPKNSLVTDTVAKRYQSSTEQANSPTIRADFVIVLLVIFAISLTINIILVFREVLGKLSSKYVLKNQRSMFHKCLYRTFCLEHLFMIKGLHQKNQNHSTNGLMEDSIHQGLLSRQTSNNTYDYQQHNSITSTPPTLPPHMFASQKLDNWGYMGTPMLSNGFMAIQPINGQYYQRSKSFNSVSPNQICFVPQYGNDQKSNHLIYDDVADQSVYLHNSATTTLPPIPIQHSPQLHSKFQQDPSNIYTSINKPRNGMVQRQLSLQARPTQIGVPYACSMNNLPVDRGQYADGLDETSNDDLNSMTSSMDMNNNRNNNQMSATVLKSAISSRVELSKEMISQADNLLRQADNILNNDNNTNNTNTTNNFNSNINNNNYDTNSAAISRTTSDTSRN